MTLLFSGIDYCEILFSFLKKLFLTPKILNLMNVKEQKFVCDLISLVADAVATDTISEAEDYLVDNYQGVQSPILEHTFNVLSNVNNKRRNLTI